MITSLLVRSAPLERNLFVRQFLLGLRCNETHHNYANNQVSLNAREQISISRFLKPILVFLGRSRNRLFNCILKWQLCTIDTNSLNVAITLRQKLQYIPLTNRVRGSYRKSRTEFFPPRFIAQA